MGGKSPPQTSLALRQGLGPSTPPQDGQSSPEHLGGGLRRLQVEARTAGSRSTGTDKGHPPALPLRPSLPPPLRPLQWGRVPFPAWGGG